tara:strand:+ start:764 stop:1075 length:312 start_codon:yes stop_codon:yes gene_type:complete
MSPFFIHIILASLFIIFSLFFFGVISITITETDESDDELKARELRDITEAVERAEENKRYADAQIGKAMRRAKHEREYANAERALNKKEEKLPPKLDAYKGKI